MTAMAGLPLLSYCLLSVGLTVSAVQMDQSAVTSAAKDVDKQSLCRKTCVQDAMPGISAACMRTKGVDASCHRNGMLRLRRRCDAKCAVLRLVNSFSMRVSPASEKEGKALLSRPEDDEVLGCIAKCLGRIIADVRRIQQECQTDIWCWVRAVGEDALRCLPTCLLAHQASPALAPVGTAAKDVENLEHRHPELVKCLAKCLNESTHTLMKLWRQCHRDEKCWEKALGSIATTCIAKCLKPGNTETKIDSLSLEEPFREQSVQSKDTLYQILLACTGKCMANDLTGYKVVSIYNECYMDVACWVNKTASDIFDCLPKCFNTFTVTPVQSTQKSKNDDFLDCMADCLKKSLPELIQIYEECHTDVDCWVKHVGVIALKCVPKCIKMLQNEATRVKKPLELTAASLPNELSTTEPPNDEFLECMASCLNRPVPELVKIYRKCRKSKKCWVKSVGLRAFMCVPRCLHWPPSVGASPPPDRQALEVKPSLLEPSVQAAGLKRGNDRFLECMSGCLNLPVSEIFDYYRECYEDRECWVRKVGRRAYECVPRCKYTSPAINVKISFQMSSNQAFAEKQSDDFLECMAQCLEKSLPELIQIYQECHTDLYCWVKHVGEIALTCVPKCTKLQRVSLPYLKSLIPVSAVKEQTIHFLSCMSSCLNRPTGELLDFNQHCGEDMSCWVQKVGRRANECVPRCKNWLPTINSNLEGRLSFLKCMAHCLIKSVRALAHIYDRCHADVRCWVKHVGKLALTCVPKCYQPQEVKLSFLQPLNQVTTVKERNDHFLECMSGCLDLPISEIIDYYRECDEDRYCWVKKVGSRAYECVDRCKHSSSTVFLQMAENRVPSVKQGNDEFPQCMSSCLAKASGELVSYYEQCKEGMSCWVEKVGERAYECVPRCKHWLPVVDSKMPVRNDFVDCIGRCLGRFAQELLHIFSKCHTDVECWIKQVGMVALKCVPQCIQPKPESLPRVEDDFV